MSIKTYQCYSISTTFALDSLSFCCPYWNPFWINFLRIRAVLRIENIIFPIVLSHSAVNTYAHSGTICCEFALCFASKALLFSWILVILLSIRKPNLTQFSTNSQCAPHGKPDLSIRCSCILLSMLTPLLYKFAANSRCAPQRRPCFSIRFS